jgi:transposase
MAYREVGMWEILNVLSRLGRGETQRQVARATGHSRKTVRRWEEAARELGWVPSAHEPDETLAAEVLAAVKPGPAAGPGEVEQRLLAHKEQIAAWLKESYAERGLRLTKVRDLLARQGVEVPYSSLHRFAVKHCGFADRRRVTVRVAECEPGELAEVDFGRLGYLEDASTGRRRLVHALVVTLVHSRHQYVHVTHTQKLCDLIDGLEGAWDFFGGVTARVVLDNLKAAITKPDRYDPTIQRTFEEYASHRGFVIDAAIPRHPTGKPHVERNVQYVRESFFRGETWTELAQVQRAAIRWCRDVAGTRVHGTTRQRPLEVFESVERAALRPFEGERFDTPAWGKCKVHSDHHVSFGKALYSVPTRFIRKQVWVRGDRGLVRIYCDGKLIKTHATQPPGGRSTDYDDYPSELSPYARRDPDRLIQEAKQRGDFVGRFAEQLLAGAFPWAKLRQAQKLLRLGERYGWERVDAACRRALAFDLIEVKRVERIVKEGLGQPGKNTPPRAGGQLVLFPGRFLRPTDSFIHATKRKDED